PGTPIRSAWPPERIVTSVLSMTRSWPKITVEIAAFAARISDESCSAERTTPSSRVSTLSAPAIDPTPCAACPHGCRRPHPAPILRQSTGAGWAELGYPTVAGRLNGAYHDMETCAPPGKVIVARNGRIVGAKFGL